MKAAIFNKYGPADVLDLKTITTPTPKNNEVLVRIHATTVTPVDTSFRAGDPWIVRLYLGLFRPKKTVLGTELAGEVTAVGKDVTRFRIGDQIFAAPADGTGAHAEFICIPDDGAIATIPSNMSLEQAATICNGGLTALPFLRDHGKIKRGDKVLIIGASGSIGTIAVQLAKQFGAHVTGVCSTVNLDLVTSLGADRLIDYTVEDFTALGDTYDIIFDTVAKSSFARVKQSLTPRGAYLVTAPSIATLSRMAWTAVFGGKRAIMAATGLRAAKDQVADMKILKGMFEAGILTTIIDRTYPLEQIATAHAYVELGHKTGNVVISVGPEEY